MLIKRSKVNSQFEENKEIGICLKPERSQFDLQENDSSFQVFAREKIKF